MPVTPDDLMAYLTELGIEAQTVTHPALHTVEESRELRGEIPGAHTKNLFLKDKKGALFLVTAREDTAIDLKGLHRRVGASSRLSFGKPELLLETLGVHPGSVTPFGLINDQPPTVTFIFDEVLTTHDEISCHPLVNTATSTLRTPDLMTFIRATGHEPVVMAFGPAEQAV